MNINLLRGRMNYFVSVESQLNLINGVIKSSNDLFQLLHRQTVVNELVHSTIAQILNFLYKIIFLLPEVLITDTGLKINKSEILSKFDKVLETWAEALFAPNAFQAAWFSFVDVWSKFSEGMTEVNNANNTIYLSLN